MAVYDKEEEDDKITTTVNTLAELGKQKGFQVETNKDYGAGPIDVVWHICIHPALRDIACGFVFVKAPETIEEAIAEGRSERIIRQQEKWESNWQEYREKEGAFLKDIEEAAIRGIRSSMDKVYLVAENEDAAKVISGKIEWLASHGSILRLDAVSLGLSMGQRGSSVITPSQKRVPEGSKIRKQAMREREAKFEKYNRPKGERRVREPKEKRKEREEKLERFSRPKGQKLKKSTKRQEAATRTD